MDNIHTRLRAVRTDLNLTTCEFSAKLNITRGAVTNMEKGARKVTDRTISQVCILFNVNEAWLRTGNGTMFNKPTTPLLDQVVEKYNLDELEKLLLVKFLNLAPDERNFIKNFLVDNFINTVLEKNEQSSALEEDFHQQNEELDELDDLDKIQLEKIKEEMFLLKKAKTSPASHFTSGKNQTI